MMPSACARALSAFFWVFFATAYTTPAKKPTVTALTEPNVTGSPKKIMPDAATGSLFNAPTMLYVVLLVARIHQAVVNEMPTAAAPENAIAKSKKLLVSGGLERKEEHDQLMIEGR